MTGGIASLAAGGRRPARRAAMEYRGSWYWCQRDEVALSRRGRSRGKKKDPNLDGVTTWVHDGLQFATRMSGHDDDSLTNPDGASGRCGRAVRACELQKSKSSSIRQP